MAVVCTECAERNDEAASRCTKCGAALPRVCAACATANGAAASFCSRCGARIDDEALARARERQQQLAGHLPRDLMERFAGQNEEPIGDVRLVTMVFVDLVESTQLVRKLGGEEMADLLDEFFDGLARAVERFGGTVAELAGDGALCIFGAPTSHEDDPERALRAALSIDRFVAALEPLRLRDAEIQPRVRIGVHTGTVVLGVVGQRYQLGYAPVGDHVHLAARLQAAARPGEILVSHVTKNLTAGLFHFGEPRMLALKGFEEEQVAHRLMREHDSAQRRSFDTDHETFVGRADDLAVLRSLLSELTVGVGGVVTVWGDAGIGKSRLLAEVRRYSTSTITWMAGRGLSYAQSTPYSVIGQLIRRAAGISEADTENAARTALRREIADVCGADRVDAIYPFVAAALGMRVEGDDGVLARSSSEALQTEIFGALQAIVTALAQRTPLVLVFEDLHWSDRASMAALDNLLALAEDLPVLYVLVARPDTDAPSWTLRQKIETVHAHLHTDIELDPLTAQASSRLAMRLLETDCLGAELENLFSIKAEGVPLFIEELARSLIEQGALEGGPQGWRLAVSADELRIPDTVQGIILARFDRLGEEQKRVLQAAAVIGPRVVQRVLEATVDTKGPLGPTLRDLERRGFLRATRRQPERMYVFRHALIRDVAYQTMRRRTRTRVHASAAAAMEQAFAGRLSEFQSIIAEHYVRAQIWDKAVDYLLRAGDESARLHAHDEARLLFAQAGDALTRLPDTGANTRRRVDTVIKRTAVSYTADSPQDGVARLREAEDLIRELGASGRLADEDRARLGWVRYWTGRLHYIGGHPADAMSSYDLALADGTDLGDVQLTTAASAMMGAAMAVSGRFSRGRVLLEQALPVLEAAGAWREWCLSCGYLGASIVACGHYREGIAMAQRAVDRAVELRGAYLIAMTRTLLSSAFLINERMEEARLAAQQAIEAGAQSGERVIFYLGLGFRGWAEGRLGKHAAATASLQESADVGTELGQALLLDDWFAVARADAALAAGELRRALVLAEDAVAAAERADGLFSGAMAHRVWAQALATSNPPQWALCEAHLTQCLELLESGGGRLPAAHARSIWSTLCRVRGDDTAAAEHAALAAAQFEASGLGAELSKA